MIVGIGTDVCDIRRIARILARHHDRFLRFLFTDNERKIGESKLDSAAFYAKRFSAKEAVGKALGTGLRGGVFWKEIEITSRSSGAPEAAVFGRTAARLKSLVPESYHSVIHVTLTDEKPLAQAFVVIEARRKEE